MKKFYEEHKQAILIVGGLGAAAALFAAIYGSNHQSKTVTKVVEDTNSDISIASRGNLTKLDKSNLLSGITTEYDRDILTVKTITQISDSVIKFSIPEFIEVVKEDRRQRRAHKDDLRKYVELWDTYTSKLEEIIEKNQKEVLKQLNIKETTYETSNSHHISEDNQELFLLQATLPQRLKLALKSNKTLTLDEFKTILRTQIDAINHEATKISQITEITKHSEEAAPIINNKVYDLLHEKYTIEEEDLNAAINLFGNNPAVQTLLMELQNANMRLMTFDF